MDAIPSKATMPLHSFAVVLVMTTLLCTAFAWYGFNTQQRLERLIHQEIDATRAAADLRYLDEARTVAVFMAAHTNDSAWLERYNELGAQFDAAYEGLRNSAPRHLVEALRGETDDARTQLRALEALAIDEIRAGDLEAAQESLFDPVYISNREFYGFGTDRFVRDFRDLVRGRFSQHQSKIRNEYAVLLVGLILVLLGWLQIFRSQLKFSHENEMLTEGLEAKVAERTEALETEIGVRRAAEADLKRSEDRLLRILDSSPMGVVISRISDGALLYRNTRLSELFKLDKASQEVATFVDFYGDAERRDEVYREIETKGAIDDVELVMRRGDDSEFPALFSGIAFDHEGEPTRLGWFYDMTALKQAEEILRESEKRLRRILEVSPAAVGIVSRNGTFRYVNSRFTEMFDIAPDVVESVSAQSLLADAETWARLEKPFEGGEPIRDEELELARPDGTTFWSLTSTREIEYKGSPALLFWIYDVSHLKAIEAGLVEETTRLQTVLDHMGHSIVMYGPDRDLQICNRQYQTLFDFPDAVLGPGATMESAVRYLIERDFPAEEVERRIAAHLSQMEKAQRYETRRPDGRIFEVSGQRRPDGGYVITHTDITDRRLAAKFVEESNARLNNILDSAPAGIAIVSNDMDERIYSNPRFNEMFSGDSEHSLIGGDIPNTFVDPVARAELQKVIVEKGYHHEAELERKRLDGSTFWCQHYWRPVSHWGEGAYMCWHLDIMERKRVEQEALEKTRILELTLESMAQGLTLYDSDWNLVSYNQRYGEHFDLPKSVMDEATDFDDVVGATMRLDYGDEWEDRLEIVKDPSRMVRVWRREFTRPSGRSLDVFSSPIPTGGFVVTTTDISERKKFEAEIQEAREKAESLARARADFVATVSHEVRTPMNGVLGMAQLMQEMELDDESRDCVDIIVNSGNSLLTIVDDLLDIAKLDAEKLELEELPFHLADVVADSVQLMEAQAADKGLDLVDSVAPSIPAVLSGDPFRLRQVLLNLIGNAIKFTDRGSIRVEAGVRSADAAQALVEIAVVDTGRGISADTQEKLFSAYTQESIDVARKYGGTGLGLTICRRLVELMEGEITLESVVDEGSTFRFTAKFGIDRETDLAEVTREGRRREVATEASIKARRPLSVLQVEDNATNRQVVHRMLGRSGHEVVNVTNGAEALEALRHRHFDIVLMDRHMPVMSGLEATRRIRQLPDEVSAIPILGITASAIESELQACLEAGMDEVLTKPVNGRTLRRTLERMTGGAADAAASRADAVALVVDDVAINRALAQKQLDKLGLACQLANDGEAALEMAMEAEYDVILADISMPRIDGLAFVGRLREWENHQGRYTPVVAMTGHAEPGDRRRFLDAGMDDYLVKPIDIERLSEVLDRCLGLDDRAVATASPDGNGAPPEAEQVAVLDLVPVTEAYGAVDEDAMAMFELYRTTTQDNIDNLRRSLEDGDTQAAIAAAHAAAGASLSAGAAEIGQLFRTIETKLDQGDLAGARQQSRDIDAAWTRLEAALRELDQQ